jgi:hypothetical protein
VGCNRRKSAAEPRPATTVVPFFVSEAALETDHDPFQRQISLIHKDELSLKNGTSLLINTRLVPLSSSSLPIIEGAPHKSPIVISLPDFPHFAGQA